MVAEAESAQKIVPNKENAPTSGHCSPCLLVTLTLSSQFNETQKGLRQHCDLQIRALLQVERAAEYCMTAYRLACHVGSKLMIAAWRSASPKRYISMHLAGCPSRPALPAQHTPCMTLPSTLNKSCQRCPSYVNCSTRCYTRTQLANRKRACALHSAHHALLFLHRSK